MKQKFLFSLMQIFCIFSILFASALFVQSCKKGDTQTIVNSTSENTIDNTKKTRGYSYFIPLNNFVYYDQTSLACPTVNYRTKGCLAASCLMGAHLMIPNLPAAMSVPPPNVNATMFSAFCAGMQIGQNVGYISNAPPYLKNTFYTYQLYNQAMSQTSTGRSATISTIKSYLSSNHPVVALINYSTGTRLPTTSAGIGHFVLIVGLSEPGSAGVGTVFYYDSYNNPGLKSYSWSLFLDAMKTGTVSYNFLRIGN